MIRRAQDRERKFCEEYEMWAGAVCLLLLLGTGTALKRSSKDCSFCPSYADDLRTLYLHTLKSSLTGILLETPAHSVLEGSKSRLTPIKYEERLNGIDYPAYGLTMIGVKRLDNLENLATHLIQQGVQGDFFECGVWRGGASIFMRGLLKAYHISDRTVHLVDSFDGLPKASTSKDSDNWSSLDLLKVPQEIVEGNFKRYGLLDDQVQFHKGFFRDSLPIVRDEMEKNNGRISLLRMDGDMYESTADILFNLAQYLTPGACIIVDDYCIPECNKAIKEFLEMHKLMPRIYSIDWCGSWFCLEDKVSVNSSWYEQFNAKRGE